MNNNGPSPLALPFITRDMLNFSHDAVFSLRVESSSLSARDLRVRGMTREGPFTFRHNQTAAGNLLNTTHRIPDFPILLTIDEPDGSLNQGNVYCRATVLLNGDPLFDLTEGFVYAGHALTYPAITGPDMHPGRGTIRMFSGSNPAAGAQVSESVPTGRRWHILGVRVTLVTDANAANRRVHFRFNSTHTWETFASVDHAASTTRVYNVGHYGASADEIDDDDIMVHLPTEVWVNSGGSITTTTTNAQAGDDFATPTLAIEEFYMPVL